MFKYEVTKLGENHFSIRVPDGIILTSYESVIALWGNDDCIYLFKDWDFSKNTTKYLCRWLGVKSVKGIRKGIEEGKYNVQL